MKRICDIKKCGPNVALDFPKIRKQRYNIIVPKKLVATGHCLVDENYLTKYRSHVVVWPPGVFPWYRKSPRPKDFQKLWGPQFSKRPTWRYPVYPVIITWLSPGCSLLVSSYHAQCPTHTVRKVRTASPHQHLNRSYLTFIICNVYDFKWI